MDKNKSLLSQLGSAFLIYKFGGLILAGIVAFIFVCILVIPELDNKYKKYGYDGYTDKIQYDQWTGEIIPKNEIATWDSSEKYIINSKGEKITFGQMQELLDEYEAIQGNFFPIREKNKDSLDDICNTLLREYLDIDYEIDNYKEDSYQFVIIGDYAGTMYSKIASACGIRGLVREVVNDKYRKQNGLEEK